MKTKGRPQSNNIQDIRAYFGTDSINQNTSKGEFVRQSRKAAQDFKIVHPWNKFTK